MKVLKSFWLLAFAIFTLGAEVESAYVQKKFERLKKTCPLLVIYAYSLPLDKRLKIENLEGDLVHTRRWNAVYNVVQVMEQFSGRSRYEDTVCFVNLNFSRGDMKSLQADWRLEQDALLFMRDGKVMGTQIIDSASFSINDMYRFLERLHINDFAEYREEEIASREKREREIRRRRSRPVVSFGVGLGYGCASPWGYNCVSPWGYGYRRYWGPGWAWW